MDRRLPNGDMGLKTWTGLHDVGTSKIVNSSFIWLALIPFLSRLLESIHAWTKFTPTLPFNFVAFYFAAFFFTLGSIIFNWKCPTIAKLAPDFGVFKAKGYSSIELKDWFHALAGSTVHADKCDPEMILHFRSEATESENLSDDDVIGRNLKKATPKMMDEFWRLNIESRLANIHKHTLNTANTRFPVWRLMASIFYTVGFALFIVVALVNLYVVTRATWDLLKSSLSSC